MSEFHDTAPLSAHNKLASHADVLVKGTQKSGERIPKDISTGVKPKTCLCESTKNGIASALQKIRHTGLAVLELNGMCDFVIYCFCSSFKMPGALLKNYTIRMWKDKYC